jgi:hypothetical protein
MFFHVATYNHYENLAAYFFLQCVDHGLQVMQHFEPERLQLELQQAIIFCHISIEAKSSNRLNGKSSIPSTTDILVSLQDHGVE